MTAHPRDYLWQPLPVCTDRRLAHWLRDRGSLTQRIQSRCACFHLELLAQRSAAIDYDEHCLIGARAGAQSWVREVSLNCGGRPVVFAHSVVEQRALRGAWRILTTLGDRPLGAVLFNDPRVRRFPLRFRSLGRHHKLYRRAAALIESPPACLWARRSLFVRRGSGLLVTEVFLPAILGLPEMRDR